MGHVREAGAESVVVAAHERADAGHVDVVGYHDEIAGLDPFAAASGRVGEHHHTAPGEYRAADGEGYVVHRVALVGVRPAG